MGANTTDDTLLRREYWRLATYMFLHGDGLHIVMNMMALAQLGPLSHTNFQTRRFWLICLITGIAGGVLSAGSYLVTHQFSLSVGFSGALFGLLGANWVYLKRHGYREFADRLKAFMIWGNVICIALTMFNILRIDNFAHIGGMLAGIVLGYLFTAPVQPNSVHWVERVVLGSLIALTLFGFFQVGLDFWGAFR
nr:rhomboid family intramembrane serine protease [Acanthopleuribacter pedis]